MFIDMRRGVYLCAAVFGAASIWGPIASADPSVEVTVGHGGYYPRSANVPVSITVRTFEEGFRGRIFLEAISSEETPVLSLSFHAGLTPLSKKKKKAVIPGKKDFTKIRAGVYTEGFAAEGPSVLEEIDTRRGGLDEPLIVCYSDIPGFLPEELLQGYRIVYARAAAAPENPAGYEGVAAVVARGGAGG